MRETQEQARLRAVVESAKRLGTYPGINWDDPTWDVNDSEKPLAHRKRRSAILYFTARRKTKSDPHIPYEKPYADFAKAIVRTRASERGITHAGQTHTMIALRYLYAAIQHTGKADPTELTRRHFKIAIADAQPNARGWTYYHVGKALQQISEWMDERVLTRARIGFNNPVPYPGGGDGLDPESQAKGMLKMPSVAALAALANISNNPLDDDERVLLRIIDLLVIGGFRIGEALRLPLDCWVETPALVDNGKVKTDPATGTPIMRCGIRYWPEKGGDPYVKWLSDIAVPVARRAVDDLTRLCADARRAARVLEKKPDRVSLPVKYNPQKLIDLGRLANIIGVRDRRSARKLVHCELGVQPAKKVGVGKGLPTFFFRVGEVEKALLRRRSEIVIIRRPGGQVQCSPNHYAWYFRISFMQVIRRSNSCRNSLALPRSTTRLAINRHWSLYSPAVA